MAAKMHKFKFTIRHRSPKAAPFHFYASSGLGWRTSENLDQLVTDMKQAGFSFNLWYVPLPVSSTYNLYQFAPEVEGTVYLGMYEVNIAEKLLPQ